MADSVIEIENLVKYIGKFQRFLIFKPIDHIWCRRFVRFCIDIGQYLGNLFVLAGSGVYQ